MKSKIIVATILIISTQAKATIQEDIQEFIDQQIERQEFTDLRKATESCSATGILTTIPIIGLQDLSNHEKKRLVRILAKCMDECATKPGMNFLSDQIQNMIDRYS